MRRFFFGYWLAVWFTGFGAICMALGGLLAAVNIFSSPEIGPDNPSTAVPVPAPMVLAERTVRPPVAVIAAVEPAVLQVMPVMHVDESISVTVLPASEVVPDETTISPVWTESPIPTITPQVNSAFVTLTPTVWYPRLPTQIVIPSINLDAPVQAVDWQPVEIDGTVYGQWQVVDQRVAGWHRNSGTPGENKNIVLNGHHNIHGAVFARLIELEPGATIILSTGNQNFLYTVVQTMVLPETGQPVTVRQENARWILPGNEERVTLVTCWPPDGNTHRLVVVALPEES